MVGDTRALLVEAQAAYRQVKDAAEAKQRDSGYGLSWIWAGNLATAERCLFEAADAADAVRRISSTHLYSIQRTGEKLTKAIGWQAANLRQALGYEIPRDYEESSLLSPEHYQSLDSRPVSNELFRNAYLCELVRRTIPGAGLSFRACELGAGMGHLARLLLKAKLVGRYVITDIPSTLVFSYLFLRLTFPEKRAVFATTAAQAKAAVSGDAELVFIPTLFDDALDAGRFDLFVNTASLGEMTNATIRHWIDFLQVKSQPRYVLMVNRYLNPVAPFHAATRQNENEASVLFDRRWKPLSWRYDPFYYRCPYACLVARYLEVILERLPEDAPECRDEEAMTRSGAFFLDVVQEEWLAVANLGKDGVVDNTASHPFTVDTSTTGTLFKLWESIRLHPNLHNITMMLTYLDFLRDDSIDEFEEAYFYEASLKEMLAEFPKSPRSELISKWLRRKEEKRQRARDAPDADLKPRALFDAISGLGSEDS